MLRHSVNGNCRADRIAQAPIAYPMSWALDESSAGFRSLTGLPIEGSNILQTRKYKPKIFAILCQDNHNRTC